MNVLLIDPSIHSTDALLSASTQSLGTWSQTRTLECQPHNPTILTLNTISQYTSMTLAVTPSPLSEDAHPVHGGTLPVLEWVK